MACTCSDKTNCSCSTPVGQFDIVKLNDPCHVDYESKACSNKGKFYDKLMESFTVPAVGSEAYLYLCEGSLWASGQYIAAKTGDNSVAVFRITGVQATKIKVLNGCDKTGDNGILGNPEPGTVIDKDTIVYPVAPFGCDAGLNALIINTLETQGIDAVIKILADATSICFTNIPDIAENEEVHVWGGTTPDCDCAPEVGVSSCFRKLLNIITGTGGRTLCFKEVPSTDTSEEDDLPKRVALFAGTNNCIKKGPSLEELQSCDSYPTTGTNPVPAIIACYEGASSLVYPEVDMILIGQEFLEDSAEVTRWITRKRKHAILFHSTSNQGGTATSGAWNTRPINAIHSQSAALTSLNSDVITILIAGTYLIRWTCSLYAGNDAQSRLINVNDAAEIYWGTVVVSSSGSSVAASASVGVAKVWVPFGTTKEIKMQYRVETTRANDGLGKATPWTENVIHAIIDITEI